MTSAGTEQTAKRQTDPKKLKSACKPGSVESNHSSRTRVTTGLKRPTRKRARIDAAPGLAADATSLFGLAPRGVYQAVECCHRRGALLPHRFTLTGCCSFQNSNLGGLFSVALSVGSRPPGVTWHVIRGSPDFPPRTRKRMRSDCPADFGANDTRYTGQAAAHCLTGALRPPSQSRWGRRAPCHPVGSPLSRVVNRMTDAMHPGTSALRRDQGVRVRHSVRL